MEDPAFAVVLGLGILGAVKHTQRRDPPH